MHGGTRTVADLPIDPKIRTSEALAQHWNFLLLSGHGALIPHAYATVPENVYLIFNCSTGCRSLVYGRDGVAYSDLLYNDDVGDFYEKMLSEIRNKRSLLKTYTNVSRAHLYTHLSVSNVKNSNYDTNCPRISEEQRSRAIYTPGTIIHDMKIVFKNTRESIRNPLLLMGLFQLPLKSDLRRAMHDSGAFKTPEEFDASVFAEKKVGENLMSLSLGKKHTLSQIFGAFSNPAHRLHITRPTLIFVTSCRGAEIADSEDRKLYTRLVRANSISKRMGAPEEIVRMGNEVRGILFPTLAAGEAARAAAAAAEGAAAGEAPIAAAEAARGGAGTGNAAGGAGTTTRVANE